MLTVIVTTESRGTSWSRRESRGHPPRSRRSPLTRSPGLSWLISIFSWPRPHLVDHVGTATCWIAGSLPSIHMRRYRPPAERRGPRSAPPRAVLASVRAPRGAEASCRSETAVRDLRHGRHLGCAEAAWSPLPPEQGCGNLGRGVRETPGPARGASPAISRLTWFSSRSGLVAIAGVSTGLPTTSMPGVMLESTDWGNGFLADVLVRHGHRESPTQRGRPTRSRIGSRLAMSERVHGLAAPARATGMPCRSPRPSGSWSLMSAPRAISPSP